MAERQYHAFWTEPVGNNAHQLSTFDDAQIVALRKKADGEYPSIRNLFVVYGELVELEPVSVVEAYRIKD